MADEEAIAVRLQCSVLEFRYSEVYFCFVPFC